ncbi:phosphatidylglycerol / phosphatidylinositol transfer protein [Metarhizium album ARSEF 1941]|uniref:Phosphatidylglycerol/phosphatidylinositol transfer protein n=1 Tax=Metarhizium album (strain ARSEF 1941) TaxID=1081103 RepID=A0A0B2X5K5_METAS|nr:phosphatidylglycerol / phosphatidylinositol transfer protein [Metarhizium album ARSEF 1941]KHO00591.1 phosphatidylglycerol / phosphatidylinositol transfer protein [Metarhizium album ARSEF 1941]
MKPLSAIVWLAACLPAAADSLKVPGDSPLEFCNANRDHDVVQIERVDISPNPPQPGKPLLVSFKGTVSKTITRGAYAKLVVKYGLIRLLATTLDLCEHAERVDLGCPVEAGTLVVTKSIDMPSAIPPGTYNVLADAYTDDDEAISCVKATVNFPRPGLFDEEL